ncbi:hypothetical protein C0992_009789 [Termitomyces sp. T32_za158]|nr:hypothetical protein C0992_009789 [Termitomyces sp. T32_za158]
MTVTHLEELTFWVFLLTQGPGKREWFKSWEFRLWTFGSVFTVTGMPITVLASRFNIDTVSPRPPHGDATVSDAIGKQCLAYIFLVGSTVGTTTTLCFLYVLARFPWFITYVKAEGAEPDVVVRLATFYQLNRIRVAFRFVFTLPLLVIAIDALHEGNHPILNDPFASDFLLMMGAVGCTVSSAITLLIFFPRSITRESGYKTKASSSPSHSHSIGITRINSNHLPLYQYQDHYNEAGQKPDPKSYASDALQPDEYEDAADEFYMYPATDEGEGEVLETSMVSPASLQSAQMSGDGGYDTDSSTFPRIHTRLYGEHGQGEGEENVLAVVSSDDTVWERGSGPGARPELSVHSYPSTPTRAGMGWGRQAQVHRREESREQQHTSPSFIQDEAPSAIEEPTTPPEIQPTQDVQQEATPRLEQEEQQQPAPSPIQPPTPPSPLAHRQRDEHRVSSVKRRRHHLSGPFFLNRSGRLAGPERAHAIPADDLGEERREDGLGGDHGLMLERVLERRKARARERARRERWAEGSVLHPYAAGGVKGGGNDNTVPGLCEVSDICPMELYSATHVLASASISIFAYARQTHRLDLGLTPPLYCWDWKLEATAVNYFYLGTPLMDSSVA